MDHPLSPLSASEITQSSEIIHSEFRDYVGEFNLITLKEPPKELVLEYLQNDTTQIPRKSFVILFDRQNGTVREVIVNLTKGCVQESKYVTDVQPPYTTTDFFGEEIVKADPEVQKRCAAMGYPDMSLVSADAWPVTFIGDEFDVSGRRILQYFMYGKKNEADNMYGNPLDFFPVVDLVTKTVIRIDELPVQADYSFGKLPVPPRPVNLRSEISYREDVKPIEVTSPHGPSFQVNGHEISWQKFNIRISFNQREGLVLHTITYKDGDKVRPLIYRASIVEMLVPYGDPRPPFHRKAAFDVGACGLGICANSLELGCDCLGTVKYFDGIINCEHGDPSTIKNAICLHEEDAGLLFKHTDFRSKEVTNLARSRRLVLSFITTILNYDYAFYWYFNQDASIGFEVKATGALSTNLFIGDPETLTSGTQGSLVAHNVTAQQHQHLFAVRLDTMFDGVDNSVSVIDVKAMEEGFGSEKNPYGQGIQVLETPLRNTTEAQTDVSSRTSRVWKVSNPSSINPITKKAVAWNLVPRNGPSLLAKPGSFIHERGEFATRAMWVTPFAGDQMFPAGYYINQQKRVGGMTDWVKEEQNIENTDIVLWHVFGLTHVPRVEDFPVMPVESCGFTLKPNNFFTSNPALDAPPPVKKSAASQCGSPIVGH